MYIYQDMFERIDISLTIRDLYSLTKHVFLGSELEFDIFFFDMGIEF